MTRHHEIGALIRRAQMDLEIGDHETALELGKEIIRLRPDEAIGHIIAGMALIGLRQPGAAESALEKALLYQPHSPGIQQLLEHVRGRLTAV